MQGQREADYQLICTRIQDRKPLGIRIKYALRALSEFHAKLQGKQQAWEQEA